MLLVLLNRVGDPSLPRNGVLRLTERPDMTVAVYLGRKQKTQHDDDNKSKISRHTVT